jgi:hypothetical protein
MKNFLIRFFHWEYWPLEILYLPFFPYYLWLALRARSLWFFSAANPGIETGGMLGESKMSIFNLLRDEWKPKTVVLEPGTTFPFALLQLREAKIPFPIIAKPDVDFW